MSTPILNRRFTVDEYHQWGRSRIFTADDRVELIEGEIVETAPIGSRHAVCVARLNELFFRLFDQEVIANANPAFGFVVSVDTCDRVIFARCVVDRQGVRYSRFDAVAK